MFAGLFFFAWAASAIFGTMIGWQKGRPIEGLAFGLLLGPIGMLLAALLPAVPNRRCPECRFGIPKLARRCGHCGAILAIGKGQHP